jgi:hypothetical protein
MAFHSRMAVAQAGLNRTDGNFAFLEKTLEGWHSDLLFPTVVPWKVGIWEVPWFGSILEGAGLGHLTPLIHPDPEVASGS